MAGEVSEFLATEERFTERSSVFRKGLGLRDLALTQILFVIGLSWVGAAAKLGPAHVVFWLLAIAFFYFPSAGGDLSEPLDAAGGRALSVGEARV